MAEQVDPPRADRIEVAPAVVVVQPDALRRARSGSSAATRGPSSACTGARRRAGRVRARSLAVSIRVPGATGGSHSNRLQSRWRRAATHVHHCRMRTHAPRSLPSASATRPRPGDRTGWRARARCRRRTATNGRRARRPDLIVVHGISLPPGEFGGPWIDALFTNRCRADAHPYFAQVAALAGVGARAGAARRRDRAVRAVSAARLARRRRRAGRAASAATTTRSASSSRAPTRAPTSRRSTAPLAALVVRRCAARIRRLSTGPRGRAQRRRARPQDRPGPRLRLAAAARRGAPRAGRWATA